MSISNVCQVEKPIGDPQPMVYHKMDAIASGVQARFEEYTGYEKRMTDATINVARALGVSESEIQRWVSHRITRLSRETEKRREIKHILDKLQSKVKTA